ncbi:MAG TPA: glycerol kinase GlpK [Steroidobacteraceae bacterium]|nr:glycerol kinase GlpK [Steroidobacteraceae bacterium]
MNPKRHVLAIDQGTTSSRAIVFDEARNIAGLGQREHPQGYPHPGWVEHDAAQIWTTQLATITEALGRAGIGARDLAAIGITNQRETTLLWNRRTGRPVAPAIVWQDRRTAQRCAGLLADGHGGLIGARTGLVPDSYFSASKLEWLLQNVPGARDGAARGELAFGTIDSWLIWNLTGGRAHVTDISNASRTMLFNIHTGDWDPELLALFDIPRPCLPQVLPCCFAPADAKLMADLNGTAVPITGIAGDQQAALFGQACLHPGMAKNTYGTGCFLLMNTGASAMRSDHHLLATVAWRLGSDATRYALEGSVFVGGAAVQWLRDGLGVIADSDAVEPLARTVPDTDGVHFVPAFTGLGAPYWDARARGALVGLTRGTTAGHIARATLEAIAFQSTDVLNAMQADAKHAVRELRVDGGGCRNALLMQFQADLLGAPVVCARQAESTALGAAALAGVGAGLWTQAQIAAGWQAGPTYLPRMTRDEAGARLQRWAQAVASTRTFQ